jgi:hypothetical protein
MQISKSKSYHSALKANSIAYVVHQIAWDKCMVINYTW